MGTALRNHYIIALTSATYTGARVFLPNATCKSQSLPTTPERSLRNRAFVRVFSKSGNITFSTGLAGIHAAYFKPYFKQHTQTHTTPTHTQLKCIPRCPHHRPWCMWQDSVSIQGPPLPTGTSSIPVCACVCVLCVCGVWCCETS